MVLSDLLDLKLTCPPENRETYGSSKSKEQQSAAYMLNLTGVNLDSFFIERKEETAAAALPRTHTVVQEKQSTNSRSRESSSSEMHVASKSFHSSGMKISSQSTNQTEASAAFANWDADFQSAGSESFVGDSKQLDLFKTASVAESFNFPASGTAITPIVATGNETIMKSTSLEHSEDLASASGTLDENNLFSEKVAPPIVESISGIVTENSVEFTGSSLNKNSVQSNQLPARGDAGVSIDEAFDDWQEFTGGGNQGSLSNAGEHIEGALESDPSEIKRIDSCPVSSMESSNNVAGDSSDDRQAFASSSDQGGGDLMKSVEGSASGQGGVGLVKSVGETTCIPFEHSSEVNSVDLWPVGNVKEHNTTEIVKQTNDSLDDWQDFTTSGQAQGTSFNQARDIMEVSHVSHREIDVDSWFTGNTTEARNADLVNGNNAMLDDWQGFAGSDQAQQSSSNEGGEIMNISFEQHERTGFVQSGVNASNKEATNTVSTNIEDNAFDIWQQFAASGHQQENLSNLGRETTSVSSEPAKEIDSMDLWLTSNVKESNSSKGVSRIDDSSDGWQDFASFGQAQGSTKNPGEGHSVKDPAGTEPLDLWSLSHTKEFKNLEQINENNDPFDDWQDFKNSHPLETSLQVPSDASLLGNSSASRPDTLLGLEFGSFAQSAPSQSQINEKESSNEANAVPTDEHLERTNGMQQMGDVDALSAIRGTTSHDNYSISKPEPADANVEKLLSQMHDLSFMLKDKLSVPDKPVDHSKS